MRPLVRLAGCTFALCLLGACSSSARPGATSSATATSEVPTPTADAPSTTATILRSAPGAEWPTYDGDIARTGLSSNGPATARGVKKLWESPTLDGDVYAQPLAMEGGSSSRPRTIRCTR